MPYKKFDKKYWFKMLEEEQIMNDNYERRVKALEAAKLRKLKRSGQNGRESHQKTEARKNAMLENVVYDEIELEIMKNNRMGKSIDASKHMEKIKTAEEQAQYDNFYQSKIQTVRRRGLIDQMLMDNKKSLFTYATKKYRWKGEEGDFESKNLTEYYRCYN